MLNKIKMSTGSVYTELVNLVRKLNICLVKGHVLKYSSIDIAENCYIYKCVRCGHETRITYTLPTVSKDWTEDFTHENGMYSCRCCSCLCTFTGHKRRVVCRQCATLPSNDEVRQILDDMISSKQIKDFIILRNGSLTYYSPVRPVEFIKVTTTLVARADENRGSDANT